MRNWILRKKYISEIITTYLILSTYNKSSQVAYSLPYGKQSFINQTVVILFVGKNKNKIKRIVKNYFFIKSLHSRIRFRLCLKGIKGSSRQYRNTKHYEVEMKDIYIFRQK